MLTSPEAAEIAVLFDVADLARLYQEGDVWPANDAEGARELAQEVKRQAGKRLRDLVARS